MGKISLETLSKYNDADLNKIKRFAFAPTGILGVHDFMLGRKIEGVLHIVVSFSAFLFCNGFGEMLCKSVGNCKNTNEITTFYSSTLILGVLCLVGSYIWAYYEGATISNLTIMRNKTPEQKIEEVRRNEEANNAKRIRVELNKKEYRINVLTLILLALILPIACVTPSIICQMSGENMCFAPGGGWIILLFAAPIEIGLCLGAIGYLIAGIKRKK